MPRLLGIFGNGFLFHLLAAAAAYVEWRIEHELPFIRYLEAGRFAVGTYAIKEFLNVACILIAEADPMNPLRLLFLDAGITAFLNDLSECEFRLHPYYIFLCLHEFPNLRKLQPCIAVNCNETRIQLATNIQKHSAILSAAEGDVNAIFAPVIHPVTNSAFSHFLFDFQREGLGAALFRFMPSGVQRVQLPQGLLEALEISVQVAVHFQIIGEQAV